MPLSTEGRTVFLNATSELGLTIDQQLPQFDQLFNLLQEASTRFNLTAIRDETGVVLKHFVDSLTCLKTGKLESGLSVIDVGTGAGFPGLPLKIVRPQLHMTFLDATKKKIDFVEEVCQQLGLQQTYPLWGRAEEIGHQPEHREHYDRAIIRAVSSLSAVCELCLPLVKIGGYVIAQKGPEVEQELDQAKSAAKKLGGQISDPIRVELPITKDKRVLIVIEKTSPTPKTYPRKLGVPAKYPLS